MLSIEIPDVEFYNDATEEFVKVKGTTLQLEHSLVSVSKWESKWNKAFLNSNDKTNEQVLDYIRCMTITKNVDPNVYLYIPADEMKKITDYIEAPMTATWFADDSTNKVGGSKSEIVTSELMYYWMIALNIPVEFQRWHLNRLLTLIRVCNIKNTPPKKMSKRDIMSRNKSLNEQRKAALMTRG